MCHKTVLRFGIGIMVFLMLAVITTSLMVGSVQAKKSNDDFIRIKPIKSYMIIGSYAPVMIYEVEISGKKYIITQGGYMTGICKK